MVWPFGGARFELGNRSLEGVGAVHAFGPVSLQGSLSPVGNGPANFVNKLPVFGLPFACPSISNFICHLLRVSMRPTCWVWLCYVGSICHFIGNGGSFGQGLLRSDLLCSHLFLPSAPGKLFRSKVSLLHQLVGDAIVREIFAKRDLSCQQG